MSVPRKRRTGKYIKEGQVLFSKFLHEGNYEMVATSVLYTVFRIPDIVNGIMRAFKNGTCFLERIKKRKGLMIC